MKFRFGNKTLLLLVAIVAIAVPLILHWQFEQKWSTPRQKIFEWTKTLDAENRRMGYSHSVPDGNGGYLHFAIANAPFEIDRDVISYSASEEIELNATRFYIKPPGIWVQDVENSAIRIWYTY